MVKAFRKYISENFLLKKGARTLIAVSGGRDSLVLCELFHLAKFDFGIAHCNFQLRGNESNSDELFAKKIARKYDVDFFSVRFETEKLANDKKLSIQEVARVLRYDWFEQIRKSNGYDFIATAHHKDDEIETFFINLIRGTGIGGLHGILPKRGNIIRPLLFADRNEINDFVRVNKLQFREDSSNASNKYLRNKLRNKILPLFDEINPSFRNTLHEDIKRLNETEKVYNYFIESRTRELLNQNTISISALKQSPFPSILLYEILKKYQFNSDVIDDIFSSLDSESGKTFYSSTSRLIKDRMKLIITQRNVNEKTETFLVSKNTKRRTTPVDFQFSEIQNSNNFQIPKNNDIACLDIENLKFPLEIRRWKRGDFFYPLGMKKRKKLSDFFTDLKLSIPEKENIWLLTSAENIVWVIGHRIDNRYKVTDKTQLIYIAKLRP